MHNVDSSEEERSVRGLLRFAGKGFVLAAFVVAFLLLPMAAGADDVRAPFPTIQSGFTSDLFGVSGATLCGVGFAPDGSAWAVDQSSGSLAHFGPGTSTVNGTSLHTYSSVPAPVRCGLATRDDKLYANVAGGVQELDATTGAAAGLFATNHGGNGYGIAVDPATHELVYAGGDGAMYTAAPGSDATLFSDQTLSTPGAGGLIDGIGFGSDSTHADPYLFLADFSTDAVVIMRHDGSIVRVLSSFPGGPDGIAVAGGATPFVLVNANDGRIYRLDFPDGNFENDPGTPAVFADDRAPDGLAARGDMAGVSPYDGCFYVTQGGLARYLDGTVENGVDSLVRICGGGGFQSGNCPIAVPATPPNSANTCVTADVVSTITVTAPALISFGSLAVGETAGPAAAPVNVKSNAGGYQLSVTRTAFTNGDLPLSIDSAAPPAGTALDLAGLTAIPLGPLNLAIGHRAGSITAAEGDTWPLSLTLGPVPATATGTHASIVTFTAVAF
jgi:hypothetical protein